MANDRPILTLDMSELDYHMDDGTAPQPM